MNSLIQLIDKKEQEIRHFRNELNKKNTEINELINKKNQEINEISDKFEQQQHYNTILRNSISNLKKELAYKKTKIQSLETELQTIQQICSDWYWYWPTEN